MFLYDVKKIKISNKSFDCVFLVFGCMCVWDGVCVYVYVCMYMYICVCIYVYVYMCEPPKMVQFDWFATSGYWAVSRG